MTPKPDRSAARRAILQQWMAEHERGPTWVARRLGYTRPYLSNVLGGKHPFANALVRACHERLGIDFGSMGIEEDVEESELRTAAALSASHPKARRQRMCSGLSTPPLYLSWHRGGRENFGSPVFVPFPLRGKLYRCVRASIRTATCTAHWTKRCRQVG